MNKINNKGLSLVELVVAIGVFAITMVAMFSVLSTTTKLFSKNNEDINVQNEATALMNQLSNYVVEAKYGTYVLETDGSETKSFVVLYEDSFVVIWRDLTTRDMYVAEWPDSYITTLTNAGIKAEFEKSDNSTIAKKAEYCKGLFDATFYAETGAIDFSGANKSRFLLAEDVESFVVTPNNTYGYAGVSLNIQSLTSSVGFAASKNINIRNLYKIEGGSSTSSSGSNGNTTPSGGNTTPSGDNTTPSGDNTTPSGDNTTPSGDNTTPTGENTNPSGDNTTPSGDNTGGNSTPAGNGGDVTSAETGARLSVSTSKGNSWGSDSAYITQFQVQIANNGSAATDNWKITITFSGSIDSIVGSWCGTYILSGDNTLIISPSGNASIGSNGSVGLGFQLKSYDASIDIISYTVE